MDPSVIGNRQVREARFVPLPIDRVTVSPILVASDEMRENEPSAEDSDGTKREKRRRREQIAQNYIQGGYIHMLTTSLKGPFPPRWRNPWEASRRRKKDKPTERIDVKAEGRRAFQQVRDSAVQQPGRSNSLRPDKSSSTSSAFIPRDLSRVPVIDLTGDPVEVPEPARQSTSLAAQQADTAGVQKASKHQNDPDTPGNRPSPCGSSRKATEKTSSGIESRLSGVEAYSSYITKQAHIKREFTEDEEESGMKKASNAQKSRVQHHKKVTKQPHIKLEFTEDDEELEAKQKLQARKPRVRHHNKGLSKKRTEEEELLYSTDDASSDQTGSKSAQAIQQFRLQQMRKYAKLAQAAKQGAYKRRAEWDNHEDNSKRMKFSSEENSSTHTSINKIKVEPEQFSHPQSPTMNAVKDSTPEKRAAAKRHAEQDGYDSPNKKRRISETSVNSASPSTSRTPTPPIKVEDLQAGQAKVKGSIDDALAGNIDFGQSASGSEVSGEESESIEVESEEDMNSDEELFWYGLPEDAYDKTPVTHELSGEARAEALRRRIAAEERHERWVEGIRNGTIRFTDQPSEQAAQKPADKLPSFSQGQLLTESTPLMYSTSKESNNTNTNQQGEMAVASLRDTGTPNTASSAYSAIFGNFSHLFPNLEPFSASESANDFNLFGDVEGADGAEDGSKPNAQQDPYAMDTQAIADAVDEAGSFLDTWDVGQDVAST